MITPRLMPRRSARAFTLVELLVVISVTALLIALLLPALSVARESANMVGCASNIRQLGTSMFTYAAESNEHFPAARGLTYDAWNTQSASYKGKGWDESLFPFLGLAVSYTNFDAAPPLGTQGEVFRCPFDSPRGSSQGVSQRRSYWLNMGFGNGSAALSPAWDADEPIRISAIRPAGSMMSSADQVMILGCRVQSATAVSNTVGYNTNNLPENSWESHEGNANAIATMHPTVIQSRTFSFIDGHAKTVLMTEFVSANDVRNRYTMYRHSGFGDGK